VLITQARIVLYLLDWATSGRSQLHPTLPPPGECARQLPDNSSAEATAPDPRSLCSTLRTKNLFVLSHHQIRVSHNKHATILARGMIGEGRGRRSQQRIFYRAADRPPPSECLIEPTDISMSVRLKNDAGMEQACVFIGNIVIFVTAGLSVCDTDLRAKSTHRENKNTKIRC
jgi:hypothetical protein